MIWKPFRTTISASKTELRGRLRLTMPTEIGVFMMNEVITSFMQTYPKLEVDVELSTRTVDLIEEGVDLALRLGPLPNSSLDRTSYCRVAPGTFCNA